MSCFDTVYFECEWCRETIEEQSKAGECSLNRYFLLNAPLSIMGDIYNKPIKCNNCGKNNIIKIKFYARVDKEG